LGPVDGTTPSPDISYISWAQLSRFSPKDGDRIHSRKRCVLNKKQGDGYVQKLTNCINIPPSQTFKSYRMIWIAPVGYKNWNEAGVTYLQVLLWQSL
jgi:hypothetical protein